MKFTKKTQKSFIGNKQVLLIIGCTFAAAVLICCFIFIPMITSPKDTDADGGDGDPPSLSDTFGVLFGDKTSSDFENNSYDAGESRDTEHSRYQGETSMRPIENDEIPYDQTKLSEVIDSIDMNYLYIQSICSTLSNTGYMERKLVYAINGDDVYIRQTVGREALHFLSDGKQFYGLDFEQREYTVISNTPYTAEMLIYFDNFEYCTSMGEEIFFGETLAYEDFTLSTAPQNEWLRYYFKEDGSIAGYARYLDGELQELMYYEYFGSEYPENAEIYFDIPADFTEYDPIVEWSDIVGDEGWE